MPKVSGKVLAWARETAGLSPSEAAQKLGIDDARGISAVERLSELEKNGDVSHAILIKMAKQYRRPLLTFYLATPPKKGDRGEDFRTLPPDHSRAADALLDALLRDIRARQSIVRAVMEDEEETKPLRFIGSLQISDGKQAAVAAISKALRVSLSEFRTQKTSEKAFEYLRACAETAGIFVLLIGNLGSHHSAIDLETFRGFALSDKLAPFVVINDQDAKTAWSFTLLHELVHLLLGVTGVSGSIFEKNIERFCNDVASDFLLPTSELSILEIQASRDFDDIIDKISAFASERHLSSSMVAYKLYKADLISKQTWEQLKKAFYDHWMRQKSKSKEKAGQADYYVVKRHRIGAALLGFVRRTLGEGALTPSKAGKVLGVKARSVEPMVGPHSYAVRSGGER